MKVVMLNTMYAPRLFGGAEHIVQQLSEGLVRHGHDVAVVAACPTREAATRTLNGVTVHDVGLVNLYWPYTSTGAVRGLESVWHLIDLHNPWMSSRAARIIDRERPDVVHTHGIVAFSPRVWTMVKQMGIPIVHTLLDHRLLCVRAAMFKRGRPCLTRCASCIAVSSVKRRPADEVDAVVGVGRSILDRHLEAGFFSRAHAEVIPVPIRFPERVPEPVERDALAIGYLGRILPGKGVDVLLAATNALAEHRWTLRIAGSGESDYVDGLRRRVRQRNTSFVGVVDATAFLATLDVLVVPSQLTESAGLVVREAHAHGVPTIVARRGGPDELVDEGRTGFKYAPDDPSALASVLATVIRDPGILRSMRDACVSAAEAHRIGPITDAYLRCYEVATERHKERTDRA